MYPYLLRNMMVNVRNKIGALHIFSPFVFIFIKISGKNNVLLETNISIHIADF